MQVTILTLPLSGQPAPLGADTVKFVLVVLVNVTVNVWELPIIMFAEVGLIPIPTTGTVTVKNAVSFLDGSAVAVTFMAYVPAAFGVQVTILPLPFVGQPASSGADTAKFVLDVPVIVT